MNAQGLNWFGIVRLGLIQTALGAIVVLTTSTINRLMIVELALPAILPGLLVTWHYALQVLRPRWGHNSDGRRRTPWIIGGMAILAAGGSLAAASIQFLEQNFFIGVAIATLAFTLIGIGVGSAGTSLLALLAQSVASDRRAAAATIVWIMMIAGFILTSAIVGKALDPFTPQRLLIIAVSICGAAWLMTVAAIWGVEKRGTIQVAGKPSAKEMAFKQAIAQVWSDTVARRFSVFIFVSMLAYSMQDLILEPYAGQIFGYTPGQSTALTGIQNSGVLIGMILVGVAATWWHNGGSALRNWTVAGCGGSALALLGLVAAGFIGPEGPLKPFVFMLGFGNGVFAVAAIGSMFNLASVGAEQRQGVRMGVFGAAQAIAFGLGGFLGTLLVDLMRLATSDPAVPYAIVFCIEACLFIASAMIAARIAQPQQGQSNENPFLLAAQHQTGG